MYSTIKKLAVSLLSLAFVGSYSFVGATDAAPAGDSFAVKEVSVVDANTLKITFNKDLLEDTSMFEFLMTSKKDETKEIVLTGVTLSAPSELTVLTQDALEVNEEYNLVVIFASDKEGKLIENGVDGMITFKAPETFDMPPVEEVPMEAAPVEAAPVEEAPMEAAPVADEMPVEAAPVEEAPQALPQTGPKEMMIVILAMMIGLGVMYTRRKA